MPHKLHHLAGLLQLLRDRSMPESGPSATEGTYKPAAHLLKALTARAEAPLQPYMVLANYPPRWQEFDPALDTGYTGEALFTKQEANAVILLHATIGEAALHAMPHAKMMAEIQEHAARLEERAEARLAGRATPKAGVRPPSAPLKPPVKTGPRALHFVAVALKGRA